MFPSTRLETLPGPMLIPLRSVTPACWTTVDGFPEFCWFESDERWETPKPSCVSCLLLRRDILKRKWYVMGVGQVWLSRNWAFRCLDRFSPLNEVIKKLLMWNKILETKRYINLREVISVLQYLEFTFECWEHQARPEIYSFRLHIDSVTFRWPLRQHLLSFDLFPRITYGTNPERPLMWWQLGQNWIESDFLTGHREILPLPVWSV